MLILFIYLPSKPKHYKAEWKKRKKTTTRYYNREQSQYSLSMAVLKAVTSVIGATETGGWFHSVPDIEIKESAHKLVQRQAHRH